MQRDGGPGGPGGAGSPLGGSFTGPAQALEIIQNHAYAYSGVQTSDGTNELTLLEFKTAISYYLVGTVEFELADIADIDFTCRIYLNGTSICEAVQRGASSANNTEVNPTKVKVILPPGTEVKVTMESSSGSREFVSRITGRLYR